jgi:toxin ParE1/3/4
MTRWSLSPRARADLDDIWSFSATRWGESQAERYLRQLQRAIEAIANSPKLGPSCDDIREGYRRFRVGSHVVFYRQTAHGVEIVRILHGAMDFDQHL